MDGRDENKDRFHLSRDFTKGSHQRDFQPLLHQLATTMLREQPQTPAQGSAGLSPRVCRGLHPFRTPWVERARDRFVDYGAMQLV